MNILKKYQKLSIEDKGNITIYSIFNSIYDILNENNISLNDNEIMNIEELTYNLYIDDDSYNFSPYKIGNFITNCYIVDNTFINKMEEFKYDDILEAINNDNYDFYIDNKYER